jgi:hypothetical protein
MIINIAGYDVLIDDEDFEKVNSLKWHRIGWGKRRSIYFAHTGPRPKRETTLLHRFIINAPNGIEVDHINLNTLDNRKCNLRLCSHRENTYNRPMQRINKSGFKGVHKKGRRYFAQIQYQGKKCCIGYFETPEEAQKAYCKE